MYNNENDLAPFLQLILNTSKQLQFWFNFICQILNSPNRNGLDCLECGKLCLVIASNLIFRKTSDRDSRYSFIDINN